jgi:hypothetical protein
MKLSRFYSHMRKWDGRKQQFLPSLELIDRRTRLVFFRVRVETIISLV